MQTVRYLLASLVSVMGLVTLLGTGIPEGNGFGIPCPEGSEDPHAEFTAQPARGPAPLEVFFNASASYDPDGTISSYGWWFGDGDEGYGVTITHTYTTPGTHNVRLNVNDNCWHYDIARQGVTVEGSINADFTAQPTTGSEPLEVTFDASGSSDQDGTIVSYEWDFDDGQSGEGVTTTHTYTSIGRYLASLTVTNDVGATHSMTREIKVGVPTAAFTAQPTSGLPPLEVAFDASASTDPGTILEYEWWFGDGEIGQGITTTHTYSTLDNYSVRLIVINDVGELDSSTQKIRVGAPTAAFTAQPTSGQVPLEVVFDATASFDQDGTIVKYLWNFDGQSGPLLEATQPTTIHTYTIPGTYQVGLWVKDNDDLYDSTALEIVVEAN